MVGKPSSDRTLGETCGGEESSEIFWGVNCSTRAWQLTAEETL